MEGLLIGRPPRPDDTGAGRGCEAPAIRPGKDLPEQTWGIKLLSRGFLWALHTSAGAFAIVACASSFSGGRKGERHGQGTDAQQQGKEETEGRQEPQERRSYALAVRVRQDAGGSKPEQQEELKLCRGMVCPVSRFPPP